MREIGLFFVVVIAILSWGTSETFGQDRNRISGFVFDESRRPLSDVYVELQMISTPRLAAFAQAASGMFNFAGLPSGRYVIKVLSTGTEYEEQSVSVALIPISPMAGRGVVSEHVDIYLRAKKREVLRCAPPGSFMFRTFPPKLETCTKPG
jgi:hypothetical protein